MIILKGILIITFAPIYFFIWLLIKIFKWIFKPNQNKKSVNENKTIVTTKSPIITTTPSKECQKKERNKMTKALRQRIIERDNYTCQICGNSTYNEPNLLLEVDHIIPISKGGKTVDNNLQCLCWKCNRSKGNKLPTFTNTIPCWKCINADTYICDKCPNGEYFIEER